MAYKNMWKVYQFQVCLINRSILIPLIYIRVNVNMMYPGFDVHINVLTHTGLFLAVCGDHSCYSPVKYMF